MKLTKERLKALIGQEINNSIGFYGGELSEQRKNALKFYLGEPLGNEVEGQSQVRSQDVLEVVESILPSMMRIFTQGESIVRFEPTGPEDVAYADQASDYINHVFMKDNNGYSILHTLFKDALISKNGFVKYYWKNDKEQKQESYENLSITEYQALLADNEVEIVEVEDTSTGFDVENTDIMDVTYNVTVKRVKDFGRVVVENVAPESMLVSKTANSLDDCDFIAQRVFKTRSELISMGFDKKIVNELPVADEEIYNTEAVTRRSYDDETMPQEYQNIDPLLTRVAVVDCYMKCDYDNDGISELRHIVVGGSGVNSYRILENEPIEQIPFATVTAIPMPHRFYGLSIYDLIGDVQEIKTTLLRQTLNNAYLQNNARTVVVDGQANIDDLLTSRAGGIVRVKSPGAVSPMAAPNFMREGLAMIDKIDQVREGRSGVSKVQMGLDSETINKSHTTATSANVMMNASTQRIELYARNFSEGVKRMFQGILQLVCKYQDQERIIKLRNRFVPMNPREWLDRYNATVQVGLGTGSQDQRLEVLGRVLAVQEKLISAGGMGIVDPQKIYNTLEKYLENAGYKDASQFFNNPATMPPPPPRQARPDPSVQLAQAEQQRLRAKDQAELQLKARKQQVDETFKAEKLNLDQQKLATEVLNEAESKNLEKEKLATKIIQQGIN
tara:strand:- start:1505 stop:3523 length:2019 start_codon:yes stop_codon:yes gene_type:complete